MDTQNNILLEWQAPSKIAHERSEKWYMISGLLCVVLIAYGILTGSWAFSLILGLLAGLFFLVRNESPRIHQVRITDLGIEVDGVLRIWSDWHCFWILRAPHYHELHVESKRRLGSDLVVQTADIDPYVIIDLMAQFIPQIDHKREKILDAIIRFCKL